MWKPVLATTAILVIAGSSLVYAQNRPGREGPQRWRPNVEDMRAFGEARLAALKAGLALNAEQEKAWPAFEQAARDFTRMRIERLNEINTGAPARAADPVERMQRRAAALTQTGEALKKLGDATAPLYNSLDDGQKRRFAVLSRLALRGGEFFGGRDGRRMWHRGMMQRGDAEGSDRASPMQRMPMQRMMSPVRGEESL